MARRIKHITRKRGAALVLLLFIGVASLIIGISMVYAGLQGRLLAVRSVQLLQAKVASDAGIDYAFNWMQNRIHDPNQPTWDNSVFPLDTSGSPVTLPGSNSQFSYVITQTTNFSTPPYDPNGFRIVSTGTNAGRTHTTTLDIEVKNLFAGILAADVIKLDGEFYTLPADQDFLIQSNSTESPSVTLKPNTPFPGDIAVGPGVEDPIEDGTVEIQPGSTVNGDIYSASDPIVFPPAPVPDTSGTTDIGVINSTMTLDPNLTRVQVSDIDLALGEVLTIAHSCFIDVTGKIDLGNSAGIDITSGAQVVIYVDGEQNGTNREAVILGKDAWIQVNGALELYLNGNMVGQNATGIINLTGDATNVSLYGTSNCGSIDLFAGSNSQMSVYAPDADLTVYNSGEFTGAVVGKSIVTKQDVKFTYDARLAVGSIDHFSAYFDRTRWWE